MYTDKVRFLIKSIERIAEDCDDFKRQIQESEYEEILEFISDFNREEINLLVKTLVRMYKNELSNYHDAMRAHTHFINSCITHCVWGKRV